MQAPAASRTVAGRDITSAKTSLLRGARIGARHVPLPVPVLKREAGNFESLRLPP
ncbi:hypothetical protein [Methylotetracoccus oryzae]|uniref:hypothetical protein n=1 Tax=Methylotetracoccus oryzae TaxID=1919059 RepID=UPI0013A5932B|nr:hypothetical protein [Methylotetracoccus oryzae]